MAISIFWLSKCMRVYLQLVHSKIPLNESMVGTLLGFQGISGTSHIKLQSTVVGCLKILEIQNPWGKIRIRSGLRFENF